MVTASTEGRRAVGAAHALPKSWLQRISRRPAFWRIVSLLIVFAAWEVAGRIPISVVFPTFSATVAAFFRMLFDGSFLQAYASTAQPLILGLFLSTAIGLGVGITMGLSRRSEWFLAPIFVVMQAAPMAALVPLITFIYGIGVTAKTLAVVILALPVIALNSYKAVRNANPVLVSMCRSFLGTQRQQIAKIIIPDASPVIFAGLRLGVAAGFIGVVLAELLITPTGIGDLILYGRAMARYADMYAAVVSILLVSSLVLAGLQSFEVRVLRPEKQGR